MGKNSSSTLINGPLIRKKRINEYRMSQAEFAKRIGISERTLHSIENDERRFRCDTVQLLVEFLELPVNVIVKANTRDVDLCDDAGELESQIELDLVFPKFGKETNFDEFLDYIRNEVLPLINDEQVSILRGYFGSIHLRIRVSPEAARQLRSQLRSNANGELVVEHEKCSPGKEDGFDNHFTENHKLGPKHFANGRSIKLNSCSVESSTALDVLQVADDTGVRDVLAIKVLGGTRRRYAGLGDVVICRVSKVDPSCEIKNKSIVRAVVVRVNTATRRDDGTYIRFESNAVVLVDKDMNPRGTRIFGAVARELRERNFAKIISLANEVV